MVEEEQHAMDKPKKLEVQTEGDLSEIKKDPIWKTWLDKAKKKKKKYPEHPSSENSYQTHIDKPIHWRALREVGERKRKKEEEENEDVSKAKVRLGDISSMQKVPNRKPSKLNDQQTMTKINWRKPLKRVRKRGEGLGNAVQHPTPESFKPFDHSSAHKPSKDTWYRKEPSEAQIGRFLKNPEGTSGREGTGADPPGGRGLGDKVQHRSDSETQTHEAKPNVQDAQSRSGTRGPVGNPQGFGKPESSRVRMADLVEEADRINTGAEPQPDKWTGRRGSALPLYQYNKALNKVRVDIVKIKIGGFGKKRRVWTDIGSKPTDIPDSKGNDKRKVPEEKPDTSHGTVARTPPKEEKIEVRSATPNPPSPAGLKGNRSSGREAETSNALGSLDKPRRGSSPIDNVDRRDAINRAIMKLKRDLDEKGEADNKGKKIPKFQALGRKRTYEKDERGKVIGILTEHGDHIEHEELKPQKVGVKSPLISERGTTKKPYQYGVGGGFVHPEKEPKKVKENYAAWKKLDQELTPSGTSPIEPPKEADPKKRTNVPKSDYFIEEIRANVLYHNKIAPLIGMVAGQVARGAMTAGKKTVQTAAELGQGLDKEEEET